MMCVRLERDVSRTTTSLFTCLLESYCLRMVHIFVKIKSFTNYFASGIHNYAAHQWSRTNPSQTPAGQLQCTSHHALIGFSEFSSSFSQGLHGRNRRH